MRPVVPLCGVHPSLTRNPQGRAEAGAGSFSPRPPALPESASDNSEDDDQR